MGLTAYSQSQSLNLVVGSTFVGDKLLFGEKAHDNLPRPFINVGLGYTHQNGVNIQSTITLDLNYIINLQTSIPIIAFKKKRKCEVFALFNNRGI